jgi:hypothetical protein
MIQANQLMAEGSYHESLGILDAEVAKVGLTENLRRFRIMVEQEWGHAIAQAAREGRLEDAHREMNWLKERFPEGSEERKRCEEFHQKVRQALGIDF